MRTTVVYLFDGTVISVRETTGWLADLVVGSESPDLIRASDAFGDGEVLIRADRIQAMVDVEHSERGA